MKAAVLHQLGAKPQYDDFPAPAAEAGASVVRVAAAGVHHLVLARASGRFYTEVPAVPHVVGTDGVGFTDDGERVFFDETVAPYGTWAELTLVTTGRLMPVAPGIDDVTAAALGNTGLAAWTAPTYRAQPSKCSRRGPVSSRCRSPTIPTSSREGWPTAPDLSTSSSTRCGAFRHWARSRRPGTALG